jgi:drug/metabolite transporter (DMT)-like permease
MTHIQRRLISWASAAIAFIILGALADRSLIDLHHAGFRGWPIVVFLGVAVLVAYIAFAAALYFGSATRSAVTLYGFAAVITVIWLAFILARSTFTQSG